LTNYQANNGRSSTLLGLIRISLFIHLVGSLVSLSDCCNKRDFELLAIHYVSAFSLLTADKSFDQLYVQVLLQEQSTLVPSMTIKNSKIASLDIRMEQ
jgi:hypothetical protein